MTGWRALTNPSIARGARSLSDASQAAAESARPAPSRGSHGRRLIPDDVVAKVKRDCARESQAVVAARYGLSVSYVYHLMDNQIRAHVEPAAEEA